MIFLLWYGIGVATIVITLFIESLWRSPRDQRIRRAFSELYKKLYKKADVVSTTILAVAALLGPILPIIFVYFITDNWHKGNN